MQYPKSIEYKRILEGIMNIVVNKVNWTLWNEMEKWHMYAASGVKFDYILMYTAV